MYPSAFEIKIIQVLAVVQMLYCCTSDITECRIFSSVQGLRCTVALLLMLGAHMNRHNYNGETALIKVNITSYHLIVVAHICHIVSLLASNLIFLQSDLLEVQSSGISSATPCSKVLLQGVHKLLCHGCKSFLNLKGLQCFLFPHYFQKSSNKTTAFTIFIGLCLSPELCILLIVL